MPQILINVFATYISVPSNKDGSVANGVGDLRPVLDNLREMDFNPRQKYWFLKNRYYAYNIDTHSFHLPRNTLNLLVSTLKHQGVKTVVSNEVYIEPKQLHGSMRDGWVDRENQIESIRHLSSYSFSMRGCDMQTGAGKTASAIRAILELAHPALIVCDGLVEQWKKEFLEKTTITEDSIYLIQGAPSLVKLFKLKHQPKIFIASIDTLRPYVANAAAPYTLMPTYSEFLTLFGIGIKVVDEFHLNFSTLVSIDLRSNVKHNLYLSATPKRSSTQEKKIFDLVFPREIIAGGGEYDKYVNITFYRYRLEFPNQNAFKTIHGYSHAKYESYIMNNNLVRQRFVFSVLLPIVNSHYIHTRKPGQKLLIFCRTVLFCDSMKEYIAGHFPDLDVRTYTQADPDSNLEEADVIVSTAQSCGTGRDIANLITVIQTCSMGSEPLIEQVLGRLRKPKNGDTPEFIDIYNTALPFHMGHYRKRSQIYRSRALKYTEHELI